MCAILKMAISFFYFFPYTFFKIVISRKSIINTRHRNKSNVYIICYF